MTRFNSSRGLQPSHCLVLCVFAFLAASALLLLWAPPHMAGGRRLPHETEDVALVMPDSYLTYNLPREVWAGGSPPENSSALVEQVRSLLSKGEQEQLVALCGRCLYHTLANVLVAHDLSYWVFVATGDIPDMWIRDSAVQLGIYLPRAARRPALRRLIEGAARTQAFMITQDPYANAYSSAWHDPAQLSKFYRLLGRGGWVATRNYELDSGAYFINLLWNYYSTPGVHAPEQLLAESLVYDAVALMVETWVVEQRHEEASPYRYSELPRDGRGAPTTYTGMIWSGFRPSDDPNTYGYSIPSNMYAAGALQRALALNAAVWRCPRLGAAAEALLADVQRGIQEHGVVEVEPGVQIYAYEVDGLGNRLVDFDDANLPSLLAAPLLGWDGYNRSVYAATRARLLSPQHNDYYFAGAEVEGIGSPHTPDRYVWPLAVAVAALTSGDGGERARALRMLLTMQCGNGLMHESVSVDALGQCTRPIFEWANTMLVALVESTMGVDCDAAAEEYRLSQVAGREGRDTSVRPTNGARDDPRYYEALESYVAHDSPFKGAADTSFHHLPQGPKWVRPEERKTQGQRAAVAGVKDEEAAVAEEARKAAAREDAAARLAKEEAEARLAVEEAEARLAEEEAEEAGRQVAGQRDERRRGLRERHAGQLLRSTAAAVAD